VENYNLHVLSLSAFAAASGLREPGASSGESSAAALRERHGAGVLAATRDFLETYWARIFLISAVVLIPCWWHRRIVASDLGSHLYNAWLVQLIRGHHAPGLYLAHQWTNVLFDSMLDVLGRFLSLQTVGSVAVSFCVLIFFWGVFAMASAAAKRGAWYAVPAMAMFAYGYTFHMGFFNYYLALGFSFWGIAIAWRGRPGEVWLIAPIALLAAAAHPLGLAWLIAGSLYVFAATRVPERIHAVLMAVSIGVLAVAHFYFWHHNIVEEQALPFFYFNGTDQFLLFGDRYKIVEYAFLLFTAVALAFDICQRHEGSSSVRRHYAIPAELYAVVVIAVLLLPEGIRFANQVPALALLTGRLTSVSGALICCMIAVMRPRRWHLAGYLAIAAVFFGFVYQDTARANRMEAQVEQLVRTLPPNQRVLGMIPPFPGSRILIQHMLDRACIGYCFSYGNYEPAAGLFRVRAAPGNPYAMTDFNSTADMEEGSYELQTEDLPAFGVYPCEAGSTELCIRALNEGDMVDPRAVPEQ
jgi:hypothetical protein